MVGKTLRPSSRLMSKALTFLDDQFAASNAVEQGNRRYHGCKDRLSRANLCQHCWWLYVVAGGVCSDSRYRPGLITQANAPSCPLPVMMLQSR